MDQAATALTLALGAFGTVTVAVAGVTLWLSRADAPRDEAAAA